MAKNTVQCRTVYKHNGRSYGYGYGATEDEACEKACEDARRRVLDDIARELGRIRCPDDCPLVTHTIDYVGECEHENSKRLRDDPERWRCLQKVEWEFWWACKPLSIANSREVKKFEKAVGYGKA